MTTPDMIDEARIKTLQHAYLIGIDAELAARLLDIYEAAKQPQEALGAEDILRILMDIEAQQDRPLPIKEIVQGFGLLSAAGCRIVKELEGKGR